MKTVPIMYGGRHVGDLKRVEKSDWKNREREPTPLDFEMAKVAMAAQAMYEVLERLPHRPEGSDGEEPWILTVCRAVCSAAESGAARGLEEDVLRRYVSHYGMGQVITAHGGDVVRIGGMLARFKEDGG